MKDKALIGGGMAIAFAAIIWSGYAEKHLMQPAVSPSTSSKTQPLNVSVEGVIESHSIPQVNAYCIATATEKSSMTGQNVSPAVRWSKGPEGTKSYALVLVDKDVPTDFTDAGAEGKTLPITMPRQDFIHWAVIGISPDITGLRTGTGKSAPSATNGYAGVNDYAKFMKDKPASTFVGYDGPCPPWNDALVHRYYFYVFALSKEITAADIPGSKDGMFDAKEVPLAITPYILAKGSVMGTYTLNPAIKK